jgi:prepilin-type N-terminal cleavage/methylation domain-containing protein
MNLRPTRRSNQAGFTIIELLVVIAIIAILVALLLAAVQKVRQAAARTRSTNNLRQLGIATMNCHDANGCIPPWAGFFPQGTSNTKATPAQHGSFFYHILPFLEHEAVQRATTGYSYTSTAVIPEYIAPLDPIPGSMTATNGEGVEAGLCSYLGNGYLLGGDENVLCYFGLRPGAATNGDTAGNLTHALDTPYTRIPEDIPDGTSNTILFVEHYSYNCMYDTTGPVKGNRTWGEDSAGPSRYAPFLIHTQVFELNAVPGQQSCYTAQAYHEAGCQAAMADGSVHIIHSSVSPTVWWRMLLPNDGQVVGPAW